MGRRRGTSAFPVARIKKMMQSDDDVGKIATVTPVLVAKALECMMEHVLREAATVAQQRRTKTVTPQHLKFCVLHNDAFDFLRATLADVPDLDDEVVNRRRRVDRPGLAERAQAREAREKERDADGAQRRSMRNVQAQPAVPVLPPVKRNRSPGERSNVQERKRVRPDIVEMEVPEVQAVQDDDDEDYDDEMREEGEGEGAPTVVAEAVAEAEEERPGFVGTYMGGEQEEGKAAERVSVHALLS